MKTSSNDRLIKEIPSEVEAWLEGVAEKGCELADKPAAGNFERTLHSSGGNIREVAKHAGPTPSRRRPGRCHAH